MLIRADPQHETDLDALLPARPLVELAGLRGASRRAWRRSTRPSRTAGRKGTIETVRKLTGIPINYYVTVNFQGFSDDRGRPGRRLHGRRPPLLQRQLELGENYSAIDLQPGYQRLDGGDALAFVRYRHTDSDLYRNARQQEFVKAVKQQVSGLARRLRSSRRS